MTGTQRTAVDEHTGGRSATSLADRYTARIGCAGPAATDLEGLTALLAAHTRTIPFENLTSFTGTPVDLDPETVLDKLLDRGRGGYCFEHALLSRMALSEMGFDTEPVLARVYRLGMPEATPMRSHAATLVHIGERTYLYDPGFGGNSPTAPLLFDPAAGPQHTPHGVYRLVDADSAGVPVRLGPDIRLMLQLHTEDGWANMYAITTGAVVDADVAALNWHVCTSPTSFFTSLLMVAVATEAERITLADRMLRRRSANEVHERTLETAADLDGALRHELGMPDIDPDLVSVAWTTITARAEAPR